MHVTESDVEERFITNLEMAVAESVFFRMTGENMNIPHSILDKIRETEPIWMEKCRGFKSPCNSEFAYYRRQDTAHVEDGKNFDVLCDACQGEADAYWQSMWEDYYRGRL